MMTAFSIMQTMTISPFQNLILNQLSFALVEGGYDEFELYFEQLTPLAILSQQAEETDQTVDEAADTTNKEMENPAVSEQDPTSEDEPIERFEYGLSGAFFKQNYETYKD
jgi:hypothetical protein